MKVYFGPFGNLFGSLFGNLFYLRRLLAFTLPFDLAVAVYIREYRTHRKIMQVIKVIELKKVMCSEMKKGPLARPLKGTLPYYPEG
jgi:hypothetical protein